MSKDQRSLKERIKSYIQEDPRSRSELLNEFKIKASRLDEILSSLDVIKRKIRTEGRPREVYLFSEESKTSFFNQIRERKALRQAEHYIQRYDLSFPTCSVESCNRDAEVIRHLDLNKPYLVAFLCKKCSEFIQDNEELKMMTTSVSLKDLRQTKARSKNAATQYLRRYLHKYGIKKPPCFLCGASKGVMAHIPNTEYPLEACFICRSCQQKIVSSDVEYPEAVHVDAYLL